MSNSRPMSPTLVQLNNRLDSREQHSPDVVQLEKQQNHILFIYDGMMKYFNRHQVLAMNGSKYIGKYQTNDMHFVMMLYKYRTKDNYPVVLREKSKHARSIYGEAYSVSPHTLMIIDKLNRNSIQCQRVREQVFAVGDTERKKSWAWMYIGTQGHWEAEMTLKDDCFKPAYVHNFQKCGTSFYRFFPDDQSRELFPQHT